jgi:DNA-directed RNA polymerase specialized sigma24 family protein
MDSSSDQTHYNQLAKILEPAASTPEAGFQLCRRKLVKFFSWRRCEDPVNLADETIFRVLKNVNNGKVILPQNPYRYVYAIALNVYREKRREEQHVPVPYDEDVVPAPTPERTNDCHQFCMKQLSAEKLKLVNDYYLIDRDELAQKLELTVNALRIRIHRIKQELRACYQECQKRSDC